MISRICFILICLFFSLTASNCGDSVDSGYSGETIIDAFPNWFPSGDKILYAGGNEANGFSLFLIDTNGTNKQIINFTSSLEADLSSDGEWIVYSSGGQIYKRKLSDTITIQLTFTGGNYFPSWSKDDEWIAFDSNNDSPNGMNFVWKMKSDGKGKKRIIYAPTLGEVRQPDWFPDGIRLVVSRYIVGHHGRPEIAIIDTSGNSIALLTNDEVFDRSPKVSPDGKFVLYYRDVNYGQTCIANADGTHSGEITNGNTIFPNWSPDGKMITFTNSSLYDGRIWIMKKDGSSARRISY